MDEFGKRVEKPAPPEGGWGYLVMVSVFIAHLTSVVPLCAFGIIYGDFLKSLGDESYGTTLSLSIFLTFGSVTGILSNYLLENYSYRQVGFLGACIQLVSYILLIYAKNLPFFVFCYGCLGGLGQGILLPAVFSSLNEYFYKRLNIITGIAQLLICIGSILYPMGSVYSIKNFGFVKTKMILAAISSLNFFGVWVLHPVEWHAKPPEGIELRSKIEPSYSGKPLLKPQEKVHEHFKSIDNAGKKMSALDLLKSPKYLNIIIGVSLSFNSDNLFIGVIAIVLTNLGFNIFEVATMTMVHFACDFVSRIIYVVVNIYYPIKNRYVLYIGSLMTIIFRIGFVTYDSYIWRTSMLAILGFLRCCIQTSFSLVLAEEYRENFPKAFSLFMVASGIFSLILGFISNHVKEVTHSDSKLLGVLTIALSMTVIFWSIEFIYKLIKKK